MMNLKTLLFLKAAGGGSPADKNLLRIAEDNEKRMSDNYQHWTTVNKTVVISGQARGGYFAEVMPNTDYTFSWVSDFGDSTSFAMRVWKDPSPSSLGTLIVDKSNIHEKTFKVESQSTDPITIVCGFYCGNAFGSAGRVLSNLQLIKERE